MSSDGIVFGGVYLENKEREYDFNFKETNN